MKLKDSNADRVRITCKAVHRMHADIMLYGMSMISCVFVLNLSIRGTYTVSLEEDRLPFHAKLLLEPGEGINSEALSLEAEVRLITSV